MSNSTGTSFSAACAGAGLTANAGLGAMRRSDAAGVAFGVGAARVGSVDVDAHFLSAEPNSNRWDYLIGVKVGGTDAAFWIESHPASSTSDAKVMLKKLNWLKQKIGTAGWAQLKQLTIKAQSHGHAFRWFTTGSIRIRPGSPEALLISGAGLDQPRKRVQIP